MPPPQTSLTLLSKRIRIDSCNKGFEEAACMSSGKTEAKIKGYIEIDQELCKGCQICIAFCPKDVISPSNKLNASGYLTVLFNDSGECTGCAICAVVCPEVAIEVYRG